ncbi:hypothetical protein [Nonomuraea sp. NPDC050691]|uniref:hypothetical protein n=1 Tax=Nonomuraea sp. NPDC050691 TaxID=3155661 RepID=UPI003400507C
MIHIETDKRGATYTLGQLFKEWGVALTSSRIGALKTGGGETLGAYVNGKKTGGDPAAILLEPHMQIALVFGAHNPSVTPPATHQFAPGEQRRTAAPELDASCDQTGEPRAGRHAFEVDDARRDGRVLASVLGQRADEPVRLQATSKAV